MRRWAHSPIRGHCMRTSHRRRAVATTAGLAACALVAAPLAASAATPVADPIVYPESGAALTLTPLGTHETGVFDESAAEIVQAWGDRLFVVNAQAGAVTVIDYSDPSTPDEEFVITSAGTANSVAVRNDGLGVIAFEAPVSTDPGTLVFFDAAADAAGSAILGEVTVGALPDMVTITENGRYAVVANEGEPDDDYTVDPEGSISIVKLHPTKVRASDQDLVRTADFHDFEEGGKKELPADVRIFGEFPEDDYPVSRNLEPEYITTQGSTAYVSLQEANAVAVVNLKNAKVDDIWALGVKDYGVEGNGIDASDRDDRINIQTWPGVVGTYQPDAIASYVVGGETYLLTANEGDAREWGDYEEPVRVEDLADDGLLCEQYLDLANDDQLGRLEVSTANGFDDALGCYDTLYSFGARSFSIWTADGSQAFDSGDQFEQITAQALPEWFNSAHDEAEFDSRSDAKGPEPEGITLGEVDGRTYAFVAFERVGGVIVYDITDPASAEFVSYVNNRDFDADHETSAAGDLGAEGLTFIPATASPTGEPLLAVANEVSGTTTVYAID